MNNLQWLFDQGKKDGYKDGYRTGYLDAYLFYTLGPPLIIVLDDESEGNE